MRPDDDNKLLQDHLTEAGDIRSCGFKSGYGTSDGTSTSKQGLVSPSSSSAKPQSTLVVAAAEGGSGSTLDEFFSRLKAYYSKYGRANRAMSDDKLRGIAEKYLGDQDALWGKLEGKYGAPKEDLARAIAKASSTPAPRISLAAIMKKEAPKEFGVPETKSTKAASKAAVSKSAHSDSSKVDQNYEHLLPGLFSKVRKGDTLLCFPGASVPADPQLDGGKDWNKKYHRGTVVDSELVLSDGKVTSGRFVMAIKTASGKTQTSFLEFDRLEQISIVAGFSKKSATASTKTKSAVAAPSSSKLLKFKMNIQVAQQLRVRKTPSFEADHVATLTSEFSDASKGTIIRAIERRTVDGLEWLKLAPDMYDALRSTSNFQAHDATTEGWVVTGTSKESAPFLVEQKEEPKKVEIKKASFPATGSELTSKPKQEEVSVTPVASQRRAPVTPVASGFSFSIGSTPKSKDKQKPASGFSFSASLAPAPGKVLPSKPATGSTFVFGGFPSASTTSSTKAADNPTKPTATTASFSFTPTNGLSEETSSTFKPHAEIEGSLGNQKAIVFQAITAKPEHKDESFEEMRSSLKDTLKSTFTTTPSPSPAGKQEQKPPDSPVSVLDELKGPKTWICYPTNFVSKAILTMQANVRASLSRRKVRVSGKASKVQALARGISARAKLWRQIWSTQLKLKDRITYGVEDFEGSTSLREGSVDRIDFRKGKVFLLSTMSSSAGVCEVLSIYGLAQVSQLNKNKTSAPFRKLPSSASDVSQWLALSKAQSQSLHAPASKIQSLLRLRDVAFNVIPIMKQSAHRTWLDTRSKDLASATSEQKKEVLRAVNNIFNCIPTLPKLGSKHFSSSMAAMNSSSSPSLASPNQELLADLWMELDNVVGLGPAKAWIRRFINENLRHFMAGETYQMRHIVIEGGLGTGKATALKLIAKAVAAAGLCTSMIVNDAGTGCSPGQVNRWNLDAGKADPKKFDAVVAQLDEAGSRSGALALIVVTGRRADDIRSITGGVSFCKREPDVIKLKPFTSMELATIVMQMMSKKVEVPSEIDVGLLSKAVENRWSDGERRQRGIYCAYDMTEYLEKETVLNLVKGGLAEKHLRACRYLNDVETKEGDDFLPTDLKVLPSCQSGAAGGSSLELSNLGLSAAALANLAPSAHDEDLRVKMEEEKQAQNERRAAIDKEIDAITGMEAAKSWFEEIRGKVRYVENGGSQSVLQNCCLNIVLTGNPGVGKTTLARLMFRFLRAYGVLKKDRFVEVNALELKGEYCGQTAPRVISHIRSAMGGAIFLDEAYALHNGDKFSAEAVRTLLTEVENNRTDVMVILAGYRDKMSTFMRADPGLPRRFPKRIHLGDYTAKELVGIAKLKAQTVHNLELHKSVDDKLEEAFNTIYQMEIPQNNGGLAVRLVEEAVGRLANRVDRELQCAADAPDVKAGLFAEQVLTLADFDLESHFDSLQSQQADADRKTNEEQTAVEKLRAEEAEALRLKMKAAQKAAMDELDAMIGFEEAKQYVKSMVRKIEFVKAGGNKKVLDTCRNLVICGNPGVGKTTFARLVHKVFHSYGVIKEDVFTERNGLQLKGQYIGQTSPKVTEAFDAAHNGTLFLDEAYALNSSSGSHGRDSFSSDAIATLLTEAENRRTTCMVILAGYEGPMRALLDSDPGLRRRFPNMLNLRDYTPNELGEIADVTARERFGVSLGDGVKSAVVNLIETTHADSIRKHNASLSIRMVEGALTALADRVMAEAENSIHDDEQQVSVSEKRLSTLEFVDFTTSHFSSDL